MTELILTEAVPALAGLELAPEMRENLEDLLMEMSQPPLGIDPSDWSWRPDVVKIMTPTTTDESAPTDAETGDLWSSGNVIWSRKNDGEDKPFRFIPIYQWTSHAMFTDNQKGPVCKSPNAVTAVNGLSCSGCPHEPWKGSEKIKPGSQQTACAATLSFLVISEELDAFYVLNFRGSSTPAGKNILYNTKRALWDKVYTLGTTDRKTSTKTWQMYECRPTSDSPDRAVQKFCRYVYDIRAAEQDRIGAELIAKREEVEKVLDGDIEDADFTELDAELNGGEGFEDSM